MRIYCTLIISTNEAIDLEATVRSHFGLSATKFVNNTDTAQLEKMSRLRLAVPRLAKVEPPKYLWALSSQDQMLSNDLDVHIQWLFSKIVASSHKLDEIKLQHCQVYINCFWEGTGRGGGPTVSPLTAKALVEHGVELRFDNYFTE
jgi:Domain of unknown function (DUF4279)